jgi:hypothetical protein
MQEVALVARNGGERWQGRRRARREEAEEEEKGDESRDWFAK